MAPLRRESSEVTAAKFIALQARRKRRLRLRKRNAANRLWRDTQRIRREIEGAREWAAANPDVAAAERGKR